MMVSNRSKEILPNISENFKNNICLMKINLQKEKAHFKFCFVLLIQSPPYLAISNFDHII
ncbi:hypothetical protein BpHYR1_043549 [Brachionus plicatilis]|uniref:Uncharacterized protein n=1 Tax=Brachionus plicatilis TaxID=10195 RepID=A0A3M7PNX9_BRAPC|nr:hypothetical protein BpHYR1_043549 [Brachionus plicatilis]